MAGAAAPGRAQVSRIQYLIAILAACVPGVDASAGAWLPEPGRTQVITTAALASETGSGAQPAVEFYAEQGLARDVALVIVAGLHGDDGHAVGDERLTAIRFGLPAPEGWALSAQVGMVEGPARDRPGDFLASEARIGVGRGWGSTATGGWFDASVAVRDCNGVVASRWDVAVGHRLSAHDRIIAKGFGEDSVCGMARDRVQVSYVRDVGEAASLEIGWRQTLTSRDGWQSSGLVLGLWRRF